MNETPEPRICEVCGRNPGKILSSGLGPVSYVRCETCIEEGAEAIGVICLRLFFTGGPARAAESSQGSWWRQNARTYLEGRYADWAEIVAAYPEFEAEFRTVADLVKLAPDGDAP